MAALRTGKVDYRKQMDCHILRKALEDRVRNHMGDFGQMLGKEKMEQAGVVDSHRSLGSEGYSWENIFI